MGLTYVPDFGPGYTAPDLNIDIDENGQIVVVNHTPTGIDPEEVEPLEPLYIPVPYQPPGSPPPEESIDYAPVIELVAPPTSMFDAVSSEGYNVQFINESLGNISRLTWYFGDGTSSTGENPTHKYSAAGTFLVRLVVVNEGGTDESSMFVVSTPVSPVAGFDFAIGGYTVYLTNTSNTTTWLWDFGDGGTSIEKNPKHVYTSGGTYTVTLKTEGLTVTKTVIIDVEILLEWKDESDNETGFKIEHSLTGEAESWNEIADIASPDIESYGVTKAKDGVDSEVLNFFRVLAYSGEESSDPSNVANVRCI